MAKMTIGAISQPTYLPWMGYFEQILYSDIFIFLDNVQFPRREWTNKNRILNSGKVMWLTVPIAKAPQKTNINQIKISYHEDWVENHLRSIEFSYKRTPFFEPVFNLLKKELKKNNQLLADLNINLINAICNYLGIYTRMVRASKKKYSTKRTELLADICKNYEINHYYTSSGAKVYLDKEIDILKRLGIKVEYQNYEPKEYKQINSDEFIPYISIIDALFNLPKEEVLKVIKSGATKRPRVSSKRHPSLFA